MAVKVMDPPLLSRTKPTERTLVFVPCRYKTSTQLPTTHYFSLTVTGVPANPISFCGLHGEMVVKFDLWPSTWRPAPLSKTACEVGIWVTTMRLTSSSSDLTA